MDELLAQFLIEGRDLVAQAQADFVRLAANPADAAAIDSAFRAVHTLKGSVAIFDMLPAERVLHAAEDKLEKARKLGTGLEPAIVTVLVECLDQTDRWIDRLERTSGLGEAAEREAAALMALFADHGDAAPLPAQSGMPDWVGDLLRREAGAAAEQPLTAFRYTPDRDCFFRGDDPLAIASAVPELLALSILPAEAGWPALAEIEPFACISVLEGLSAAPIASVQAAFRMAADQVGIVALEAAAGLAPGPDPAGAVPSANTLRVDAARVDALADGVGELLIAANSLLPIAQQADRIDHDLALRIRAAHAQVDRVIASLHRTVSAVRMVSLAPTLRRLPRVVREIAAQLDKSARFDLSGEAVEVDKQIADGLFEPLLHLIRNALDHGIESRDDRIAAGKPAEGALALAVAREGDMIIVSLSDDGAGIDPADIRSIAVARGLFTAEASELLSDAAALRLIFEPGFSTARAVTGVSGRGVGMDAVQVAIDRLRGAIEIDSVPGRGTTFRLRLPANAITTRLLVIEVGSDRYGVALDQIVETIRVDNDALVPLGSGSAFVLRDRTVPVLSLATLLGGEQRPAAAAKLLITRLGGEPVAVRVDGFAERIDTLVRPSSGILASVPGVTGTTLTGEGDVLLVLNLPELVA